MQLCTHPAWIEIDSWQLKKNFQEVRKKIGSRRFCLPIKANGYGHGLHLVAQVAQEAGVDLLGVACLKEALELRLKGIHLPILIFGAIHEDQIETLLEQDLEITISSLYKAKLVEEKCRIFGKKCRVHVEVDTGMARTGVRPVSALPLLEFLDHSPYFEVVGCYSHLATADLPNDPVALQQIEIFQQLKERLKNYPICFHLANSGGVAYYPDSYFDMVRPGLLCYGYFPSKEHPIDLNVAPCLALKGKISYFKVVPEGQGISYGHLYHTKKESRVVTVPVGHGDGYARSLRKEAQVLIRGKKYPIAGAICMDQFMVDIGLDEAYVGDEVVLIGSQGDQTISLWEICSWAQTIPHEMLVSFNERLPRLKMVRSVRSPDLLPEIEEQTVARRE
jgi:alanine racemase